MQELGPIIFRTIFFYFFIVLLYRIMGKREIGQLGVIDLIISILMAEMVAISIENIDKSILQTIIPLSLLGLLEILLAFISIKSRTFRRIFDGKPSLIVCNGKVNYKEMVRQRYSMDDLLLSLRQKAIKDLKDVEYAFLEPNGKLSIFKYNLFKISSPYPMPLILDGEINIKTLEFLKKEKSWLVQILDQKGLTITDIFYAFYNNKKIYLIKKDEIE